MSEVYIEVLRCNWQGMPASDCSPDFPFSRPPDFTIPFLRVRHRESRLKTKLLEFFNDARVGRACFFDILASALFISHSQFRNAETKE
jgi:hypothetical protein